MVANSTPNRPLERIRFVVVHHSASADVYTDIPELFAERQRRNEGYNFIIDDDEAFKDPAKAHDGHAEFRQDAGDLVISNGTYALNAEAWNICIDGNFQVNEPTADEVEALIQVIATKTRRWGWKKHDVWRIIGHRDAGEKYARVRYVTDCPGKNLYKLLPHVRERVASYLPE